MYDIEYINSCDSLVPDHVQMLALNLKEDGLRLFKNLLSSEKFCICGCREKIASTRIEAVNSAYTVSMRTLMCRNLTARERALTETTDLKKLQRIVTLLCFYGKRIQDLLLWSWKMTITLTQQAFHRPDKF